MTGRRSAPGRRLWRPERIVPFAWHEGADYFFGGGLVVIAAHSSGGMVYGLEAAGGAWCLLGVFTNGPLGIVRLVGRRPHAVVDAVIALGLALTPLLVDHHLDWVAVGLAEAIALVMLRIASWTDFSGASRRLGVRTGAARGTPAPAGVGTGAGSGGAAGAGATEAGAGDTRAGAGGREAGLQRAARLAGRGAGQARRSAVAAGSRVSPAVDKGARRVGRAIGAARRAGKRATGN